MACARLRESVSPRPVPSISVESAARRSNGRNTRAACSLSSPGPVSTTSSRRRPGVALAEVRPHDAARAVVLDRVAEQVERDLLEALGVGQDVAVQPAVHVARQLDPALDRERPHELERVHQRIAAVHRLERERLPAGLDARDVEHLVDQLEQVVAGAQDVLDARLRLVLEAVEHEQLAEAEDRVERRAQLVAHAREELALGLVGALGLVARVAGGGLGALAVGDVGRDAAQARRACPRGRAA